MKTRRSVWLGRSIAGLLAALCGLVVWLWRRDPLADITPPTPATASAQATARFDVPAHPPRTQQGFVGSVACRECHAALCDEYAPHPMARSLRPVLEAEPLEVYGPDHGFTVSGEFHFAERTLAAVTHHILRRDSAGTVLYCQSQPIAYEVGSGERGRAFLVQHADLLFQSPLTWYTGRQGWDLSPGYVGNHRRFDRRITEGCLACHAGRVETLATAPDRYAAQPFSEPGIGCERCHGPGGPHIEWQRSAFHAGTDPIVNPDRLDPSARESVCYQCHLTGVDRVVRHGRNEFDFRPGDRVADIWITFITDADLRDATSTHAVSHVEQLEASRCWQASNGAFGCTSCHDPHRTPSVAERDLHFRQRCLTCHGAQAVPCGLPAERRIEQQPADSCIACHMPQVSADDVPHTALTDHRILKQPPQTATAAPPAVPRIALTAAARAETPWWEQQRAEGIMFVRRAAVLQDPVLAEQALTRLRPLAETLPTDLALQAALAEVYSLTDDPAAAVDVWNQVLQQAPNHEGALEALAVFRHDAGQFLPALEYFDRLLEINPARSMYHGRRAHILGRLGRFPEAVAAGQRALELDSSNLMLLEWLTEACKLAGDDAVAEGYRRRAAALRAAEVAAPAIP